MNQLVGKFIRLHASVVSVIIVDYFLGSDFKYTSSALTMLGDCGIGALISSTSPASSAALNVLAPKAANVVPFCLNLGKFSIKLWRLGGPFLSLLNHSTSLQKPGTVEP